MVGGHEPEVDIRDNPHLLPHNSEKDVGHPPGNRDMSTDKLEDATPGERHPRGPSRGCGG